jgi:hypothetical protein
LPVANGGTGQTSYTNGQLLIGNTTGNTLTKATLTAGSNVTITNGNGAITIAATGGGSAATPTALGTVYGSMTTSGAAPYLTAVGYAAGASNSGTGSQGTTAFGWSALTANTSGAENTAMGSAVMYGNTTGAGNTAMGFNTLITNISGSNNTAIGASALRLNNTGFSMTCVGYQAGYSNVSGGYSTYIGKQAGYSATGSGNVFIGDNAGYNSTGSNNVFIGNGPAASGYAMTTGSKNTILGGYSGNQGGLDIRTASNYIVLADGDGNPRGYFDNNGTFNQNQTANQAIALLKNTVASNTQVNFMIQITDASTSGSKYYAIATYAGSSPAYRFIVADSGTVTNATGTYGTISDIKLKENIVDATPKLADVMRLQVRNFNLKSNPSEKHIGFIAQEMETVFPAMVESHFDRDADGNTTDTITKTVKTSILVPILVKAIQELKAEFDAYKASHP